MDNALQPLLENKRIRSAAHAGEFKGDREGIEEVNMILSILPLTVQSLGRHLTGSHEVGLRVASSLGSRAASHGGGAIEEEMSVNKFTSCKIKIMRGGKKPSRQHHSGEPLTFGR